MRKVWYNIDRIKNAAHKLKKSSEEIHNIVSDGRFSLDEEDLIRRVIKAVIPSLRSERDKWLADSILRKTRCLDG